MNVLVIAPHPDDEILGVGGTLIKHIHSGNSVYVCIMTRGYAPAFSEEDELVNRKETKACFEYLGISGLYYLDFPASMIEKSDRMDVNGALYKVIETVHPEEVYIPHWGDMQKDHQIVAEAAMVCLRPKYNNGVKRIYAYETLSETGWNAPNIQNAFIPNVYVDISDTLEEKINALEYYQSQLGAYPSTRSLSSVRSLAMYRGTMMNVIAAEAFVLIRDMR